MSGGVNGYLPPLILPKTQLAQALNTTCRGDYVSQRSVFRKIYLDPLSQSILDNAVNLGEFQAACYFKPDFGQEGIAVVAGGRLMSIFPDPQVSSARVVAIDSYFGPAWVNGNNYTKNSIVSYIGTDGIKRDYAVYTEAYAPTVAVSVIPPPDDTGNWQQLNLPSGENWLWQGEMFVFWNDGASNPVFYNVNTGTASRSTYGTILTRKKTNITTAFTINAPGTPTTGVKVTDNTNMAVNDTLWITDFGNVVVLRVDADTVTIDVNNVNIRTGSKIPTSASYKTGVETVFWNKLTSNQLPPGRMGVNGMGRNWFSGVDGKTFYASDISGGSSGTAANDFRDAILSITENAFLNGGGFFTVPGAIGAITAMRFVSNLDQSLGQGPLQVFTRFSAFSCQAPVDRTQWQNLNNPILTESIKGYGATGQDSTINVNSDLLFRSPIGFSSQILARRDFDTWGNVPISTEVSKVTDADDQTLLNFGSAINFDNRVYFTANPIRIDRGVIHKVIVPLNLDPVSSLRGKAPSIYDSERWTGLNVLKLITGSFENRERAFAITWNAVDSQVELYEILPSNDTSIMDNDITRVVWKFGTASLFRDSERVFKRLVDGEIFVDDLEGQVDFQVWWRPDQYPCFQPWLAWSECQKIPLNAHAPSFRPRMGHGPPPMKACDNVNNRQLVYGYTFDLMYIITGKCRFLGGRYKAVEADEPEFATPNCVNAAGLAALQAILPKPKPLPPVPPGPPSGGAVVIIDDSGNVITDSDGNVLLG